MKLERDILLWPPGPDPESWNSDTPNEGLYFDNDERAIVNTFADYQGLYLLEPGLDNLTFVRLEITPTKNTQYLNAYQIILEEFDCCWNNPLPPEATWEQIDCSTVKRIWLERG